jgi:hypothetical protein
VSETGAEARLFDLVSKAGKIRMIKHTDGLCRVLNFGFEIFGFVSDFDFGFRISFALIIPHSAFSFGRGRCAIMSKIGGGPWPNPQTRPFFPQ